MDVKRHLNNETVVARPPSKIYEFQKTFRRHKVGFMATAAVFLALVVGVTLTTWQAVRATTAKREEAVQRQKAVEAQSGEARLRRQAQEQELIARQHAYASDMYQAQQALDEDNLGGALDLLNRQRPGLGQKDLRGWEWRYLWQQTRTEAKSILCQIDGEVESLVVSLDGRWLATGAAHPSGISVWDLRKHLEVARLAKDEGQVRAAFSPAEPLLVFAGTMAPASGPSQNILHFWNTATGRMANELPLEEPCIGLAFANEGQTLVTSTSAGSTGRVTLWSMPQGTKLASFASQQQHLVPATSFAVTSDSRLAAYASGDGRIHIIDLRDGHELWNGLASKVFVTALAFSPDGKTLASAAGFGESDIRLWDAPTGKETGRLAGHTSWVSSLVFWPDANRLASSSADQTIRLWDVNGRKCVRVMRGERAEIWRLALLPDAKTLVSGGKEGAVCFWDTSIPHTNRRYFAIPANILTWRFAPDSRSLLTVDQQGRVARWSGPDFQEVEPLLAARGAAVSPVFSTDGNLLGVGSPNGVVQVWDLARKVLLRQLTNSTGEIHPQQFIADGDKLMTLAGQNLFQEWDLANGSEIQSWPGPAPVLASGVSADERMAIALGPEGGVLRDLFRPNTISRSLDILEGASVASSPNGRWLAVASHLGYVRLWDTSTWREEPKLRGFIHAAGGAAFSPDGKTARCRLLKFQQGGEALGHGELAGCVHVRKREWRVRFHLSRIFAGWQHRWSFESRG
jgi:WD40 repeat protein